MDRRRQGCAEWFVDGLDRRTNAVIATVPAEGWLSAPRSVVAGVGSIGVQVEAIDERDGRGEGEASLFRVHIFRGGDEPMCSWSTATYEVTGADALEVIDWARQAAGLDGLYAVAVVVNSAWSAGEDEFAVWLVGTDANIGSPNEQQQRWLDMMLERREQYRREQQAS